jgi:hypothetical protein
MNEVPLDSEDFTALDAQISSLPVDLPTRLHTLTQTGQRIRNPACKPGGPYVRSALHGSACSPGDPQKTTTLKNRVNRAISVDAHARAVRSVNQGF